MSGLEWAFLIGYLIISLVGSCIGMLYLLELIDYPRSEEGWRIELYNTHGIVRDTILTSYRFHHRRQIKELKRKKKEDGKKGKNGGASRRGLAGSQSLSASRSLPASAPDFRVRRNQQILRDDDNHYQLSRGGDPGASDRAVQDAPQGAKSEGPSASPRPAHESGKNRPDSAGSSKDLSHQAGEGGRTGGVKSLMDEYNAPFWKKLVTHAEELGL